MRPFLQAGSAVVETIDTTACWLGDVQPGQIFTVPLSHLLLIVQLIPLFSPPEGSVSEGGGTSNSSACGCLCTVYAVTVPSHLTTNSNHLIPYVYVKLSVRK
jgi:hypothetical protein